jgi:hypothetical protein
MICNILSNELLNAGTDTEKIRALSEGFTEVKYLHIGGKRWKRN